MLHFLWSSCRSAWQCVFRCCDRVVHSRLVRLLCSVFALWRRLPWRRLLKPESLACSLVLFAIVVASLGMDRQPIGANVHNLALAPDKGPAAPPEPENATMHLQGEVAIHLQVALLQSAIAKLEKVDAYSATFVKHERIEGKLQDEQIMQMKINHAPHKVFFKVEKGDIGREILFPAADDDPRLIVKLARLGYRLPAVKFNPTDATPMSESRYPITMAGIKAFSELALEIRKKDLRLGNKVQAEMRDNSEFDGRPCYEFTITYADASVSENYRKCILKFDRQMMIPVYARNFTWADKAPDSDPNRLDETTLLEYYAFKDVKLEGAVSKAAFSVDNPDYHFVKRQ